MDKRSGRECVREGLGVCIVEGCVWGMRLPGGLEGAGVGGHHSHDDDDDDDDDDDVGLEGGGGAGPCDADDAPVLLQVAWQQPADEPAFWDLRPAHRPYLLVSFFLGSWVVFIRVRWRGLGMLVMGSGWLHRALSVRARRVQRRFCRFDAGCVCMELDCWMNGTGVGCND